MGDTPITNTSTGVTPEQLGGSGPSTDLNPPGAAPTTPAGTTKVENGIAYDASGKALGPVNTPAEKPSGIDLSSGLVPKAPAPIDLSAGLVSKSPEVLAKQAAWQKAGEVKQTTPSWAGAQMGISATPKPASSGTSWDERHGVSPTQVADWARRAQEDVRHGTDQTWLGAVLKYMGAKGTEYGVSEKTSEIMGGPLLGTLRVAQAPGDISQGHPIKAINKVVGGSMQAAGPALMLAPEALPLYAPMTKASELAGSVAREMGADEDTQEFVENAAGLWVAHKAHGMQSDTSFNNFNRSVEDHVNATKQLSQASKDLLVARTAPAGTPEAENIGAAQDAYNQAVQTHAETKQTLVEANAALEAESKVGPKTQAAIDAAKAVVSGVKQAASLGKAPTVREAIRRISPPSKGKAPEYIKSVERVEEDLTHILNTDPRASVDPQGLSDSIQDHIDSITDELLRRSKATIEETKPVVPDIENRVREAMNNYAREHRGEMGSDAEVEAAMQKVMEQILRTQGGEGGEPPTSRAVNLHEAEGLRRKLNKDGQRQFATNATPTTDAYKLLSQHVASEVLRPAIDERFTADGVDNVKEAREKMADLIEVKDQVEKAQQQAIKMGQPGIIRSVMNRLGTPGAIISIIAGAHSPHLGIPGMIAVVLGDRIAANLSNPNAILGRATELAKENPNARATTIDTSRADQKGPPPAGEPPATPAPPQPPVPQPPPTNHALHASLATYYDVPVDSTEPSASLEALKQRFYKAGQDIAEGKIKPTPEQAEARAKMLDTVNKATAEDRKIQAEQHQKAMDKYNADQEKAAEKAQKEQEKAADKAAKDAEKQAAEQQKIQEEKQKLLDERKVAEEKEQQKTADNVKKELADKEKEDLKAKENPEKEKKPKPAGRTNLIGKLTHVIHPDNPENAADQRIQRTPARSLFGHSDESALGHEWAHVAQAAIENLGSGDISSHLHPDSQPLTEGGTPAFGGVERGKAPWVENPNVEDAHTPEAILENTKKHIRVNMAGAVANEMIHGIPIEDNAGLDSDMAQSKQWLEAHGIEGADADAMIQDAINQVREGFTKHPQILDAIKENSHVRERGLSPQLHASRERVAKFGDHIKDIIDANENNGHDGEGNSGNAKEPVSGVQGKDSKAGEKAASGEGGEEVKPGRAAIGQGGHAGGGVASEEELARPGRFVKVSRSGVPTDQNKVPDFNLRPGEAGYQVTKEGPKLVAGEESPSTKRGAEAYHKEVFGQRANLQGAVAEEAPELRVPFKEGRSIPPERSAGKHDAAIKAGGGIPGGIQEGDPEINLPDLALFHDPTTGSTLALKADQVTSENVKNQIQKSRQTYLKAKPEESRIPTEGQPGYDEEIHGKSPEVKTQNDLRKAAKEINPNFNPAPVQPDPRESEIADAYKAAKHEPNNPAVKASYDALKRDIDSQYDLLKKQGFDLETAKENPYGLSSEIPAHEELHRDVLRNKHLAVWEGGAPPADHPLSERDPKTGLTYNDKFRMVHDVFGHAAERTDFSPAGEESAWNLHRQLFSPEARPALATETRGQAAYTYKYGDFPPQKATILPEHLQVRPEDLGKRAELRGAVAEPTLSDRLVETFGTTEDPRDAGFILNDGRMVPLHDTHNTMLDTLYNKYGDIGINDAERTAFINNENAVRTRYRVDKGGQEVVFSVPRNGVNEEQIQRMRQSVGKIRNGNAVMEIAEPNGGKSTKKEFARPSDIDPMLREIGAHPDSKSWIPDVTKKVAGGANPENPEAESKRYGFEIHPESRQALEANPTADDFQKYADDTKEIRQAHPDIKLGWDTTGEKPELNIGASTDDRQLAEDMAKKLDQRSIYDTKEDKVIPTGGTGTKTQFPEYPFEQRLEDLNKGRSELRGKTLSPKAQKMIDKVKEESYATYPLDEIKSGDPWISPAEKEAGGKPGLDHSDAGFLHPDGSISLIESAYMHDPFLAALGDDFDHGKFIKTTGSGTFDMFDDRGNGNSSNPKTFSLTLGDKPTPQQVEAIAAMTKHLREGSPDFQTVDVSWPGSHKTIDFATPGKVIQELGGERSELRGKPADVKKAQDTTDVHPVGSSVVLRENPLPVKPSPGNDIPSTVDVAMALNKFTKKSIGSLELGKAEPQEMVDRAKSLAEDEARYQLAQNNTGAAWYTTQMAEHDKILQGMRPETKDPAKLSMFKMAEAILSSGQKPYANFKTTVRAWDQYQETGKFPAFNPDTKKSWGPRGIPAYGNAFESMNRLIAEKGEQGASDWLLSEHPVSELKEYNDNVKGKKDDLQLGAMILGPKRGPFAQNLHGLESAFTADMWVARTWHRWMGTAEIAPDGELATDRPRSDKERELMKKSFSETADKLGMTTSSLQAVLWYYEQALYSAHGSPKESWSFSDAAQRVADDEASTFNFGHNRSELRGGPQQAAPKTYSVPAGWTETGPTKAPGMITPGNINLTTRPVVKNDDGTTSSEYSTSFQDDKGREVIVPTVVNGKFLTPDGKKPKPGSPEEKAMFQKAWQHYEQTGEHLGIYDTPEHADAAAQQIHNRPPANAAEKSGLDTLAGK